MARSGNKLTRRHLKIPVETEDLRSLQLGDIVTLDGLVYTAREGVYHRIMEEGETAPFLFSQVGNVNFHCSPAASVTSDGSYKIGAVTATASFRFAKWLDRWFALSGAKIIIGKGGMTPEVYRQNFVPNGAIYLTTVGYGTGALLGRGIKKVRDCFWLEELGIAQACWVFEVENFGPFIVESDYRGNSLFERENQMIVENIDRLYEGLKPAILGRLGETDDPGREMI